MKNAIPPNDAPPRLTHNNTIVITKPKGNSGMTGKKLVARSILDKSLPNREVIEPGEYSCLDLGLSVSDLSNKTLVKTALTLAPVKADA
ncbi:unnamed protein product [[Candida] boidinii]|nr:unnamed protein product [[Candida] boidinii]